MDLKEQQDALFSKLKDIGVETETFEHPAAPTVEEHTKHVEHIADAGQAKNLCLRDKKGNMYLITALKDTPTGLKEISERLGVPKSSPVRLATEDKMREALQVQPGSVTPFAVMFGSAEKVRLLVDVKFKECKTLLFHPFINTATTTITPEGFEKFLIAVGRTPEYVDFNSDSSLQLAAEKSEPAPKKEKPQKNEPKKEKKEKKSDETPPQKKKPDSAPETPPIQASTGPAKTAVAAAPANHELSSDEWASGKYGRPSGRLDVKAWSSTIFSMPPGWEDAPEWLASLADGDGRPCGALTQVAWNKSIFQKPVGW